MKESSLTSLALEQQWTAIYTRHVGLVYRLCYIYLKILGELPEITLI
ncbi:hypothetical protein [Paenibacillus macerans]|nr:hypothetical protein [Paenibacillus macerans]MCM3701479.1 hypothetical protein [Paenibacillus macerans]